ncbi:MAG: hypothetical protein IPO27_18390 [Bacteroidetes bacterium]|nr:hypothetical protein [Bacteroidota bacterium]
MKIRSTYIYTAAIMVICCVFSATLHAQDCNSGYQSALQMFQKGQYDLVPGATVACRQDGQAKKKNGQAIDVALVTRVYKLVYESYMRIDNISGANSALDELGSLIGKDREGAKSAVNAASF